jgi:hypothetical protein
LRPALRGPGTGGDGANAVGHGLGDSVTGGDQARELAREGRKEGGRVY